MARVTSGAHSWDRHTTTISVSPQVWQGDSMCPSAKLAKTSVLSAARGPSLKEVGWQGVPCLRWGKRWPGVVGMEKQGCEGRANLQDPRQGALG